jgi:hypothetical protein
MDHCVQQCFASENAWIHVLYSGRTQTEENKRGINSIRGKARVVSPYCVVRGWGHDGNPTSGVISTDEEAVDDCECARRPGHHEPDVVSRRVSLNGCRPHLERWYQKVVVGMWRERARAHSRQGGARNLAQERLCSAQLRLQIRLLVEATLKYQG